MKVIEYFLKLKFYDLAIYKFGVGTRNLIDCRRVLKDEEYVKIVKKLYKEYCAIAKKMIPNVDLKEKMRLLLFILNLDLYETFQKKHSKRFMKKKLTK